MSPPPSFNTLKSLRIRIVGAGVAGLGAALSLHHVGFEDIIVYESAKKLEEVGAGIQVAPNMSRILDRLGVLEQLSEDAAALSACSLRRWDNDEILGSMPFMPQAEVDYGSPLWAVHRADLQTAMLRSAEEKNIPVQCNKRVDDMSFEEGIIKFSDGEQVEADVILAADGIKSLARRKMLAKHHLEDTPEPSGDAAYRILIPREKLEPYPNLLSILDDKLGVRWMGPGRHIMAYPLRGGKLFNMVLLHPDTGSTSESWTTKGNKEEMANYFKEWCQPVQDLISLASDTDIMESRLMMHTSLTSWCEGRAALLGDACHPMLPYVAQGAAQAIEDAVVLSVLLSSIQSVDQVHQALQAYQTIRKDRAERIQASATATQRTLHLPDGPEQQARDKGFRRATPGATQGDRWVDKSWQNFMWGTDVMQDARDYLVTSGLLDEWKSQVKPQTKVNLRPTLSCASTTLVANDDKENKSVSSLGDLTSTLKPQLKAGHANPTHNRRHSLLHLFVQGKDTRSKATQEKNRRVSLILPIQTSSALPQPQPTAAASRSKFADVLQAARKMLRL